MSECRIFVKKSTKKTLMAMRQDYQLSISTIVSIIFNNLMPYYHETIRTKYFIENSTRIKIKPRIDEHLLTCYECNQNQLRNAVEFYIVQKKLKPIEQDKDFRKADKQIQQDLEETEETNWNYSNEFRATTRLVRRNKSYFKKILGE